MRNTKLCAKMMEKGYTQKALAHAIGMSENTMTSRINGYSPFNTIEITEIGKVLKLSRAEQVNIFLPQSSQKWEISMGTGAHD